MLGGLTMFIKQPYILGIFGMYFFYDVVYVIFSYIRLSAAQSEANSMSDVTATLFKPIFVSQLIGLVFHLAGTQPLLAYFGDDSASCLSPV